MRRRAIIGVFAAACLWPGMAGAQGPAGLAKIADALRGVGAGASAPAVLLRDASSLATLRGDPDVVQLLAALEQAGAGERHELLVAWTRELGIGREELLHLLRPAAPVIVAERRVCLDDATPLSAFTTGVGAAANWLPGAVPPAPQALLDELPRLPVDDVHRRLAVVNETLNGAYYVTYFDGEPYLTLTVDGSTYHFTRNDNGWETQAGRHPVEYTIDDEGLQPDVLARRFQPPHPDAHLVGLETVRGRIMPIFSEQTTLSVFRDFTVYNSHSGWGSGRSDGVLQRTADRVPLKTVRLHQNLAESQPELLPGPLASLLEDGQTLTTVASVPGLPADAITGDAPYEALMIADGAGEGRLGILLQDGAPLLVRHDGQEYFVELKGVGTSVRLDPEGRTADWHKPVHDRLSHTLRYGRVSQEQAVQEFAGYGFTQASSNDSPAVGALRSRPVFGLLLPELGEQAKTLEISEYADLDPRKLSGQVYRLSTTTRRVAFADHPAFGVRYPNAPLRLEATQREYGRIVGDLLVRETGQSYHASPHAENFAWYPETGTVVHVDYSDIHSGTRSSDFLAGTQELGIFDPKGNPLPGARVFYEGLRSSLEPRGLWSREMQHLAGTEASVKELDSAISKTWLLHFDLLHPERLAWVRRTSSRVVLFDDRGMGWSATDASMSLHYRYDGAKPPPEQNRGMFVSGRRSAEYAIEHLRALIAFPPNREAFPTQVKAIEDELIPEAVAIRDDWTKVIEAEDAAGWKRTLWQYGKLEAPIARRNADLNDAFARLFGVEVQNRAMVEEWIALWSLDARRRPENLGQRKRGGSH